MSHTYMPEKLDRQKAAKAMGKDLPISPKVAIVISDFLRGRELDNAIAVLERVEQMEEAIPFPRFAHGLGHRGGQSMAAGRYPIKACGEILQLLRNCKANAANQGLTGSLIITHMAAQRASEPFRNRAKERITFKRAHVEIIVTEGVAPKKANKKSEKSSMSKSEAGKSVEHEKTHAAHKSEKKPAKVTA